MNRPDEQGPRSPALGPGTLNHLSRWLALFGGSLMLATGALIIVSICARRFLATSIPGDVELIQAATAVAAFAFLPLGQITRSTIVVDTFTRSLPNRVCNVIDAFWDVAYASFAVILSWRLSVAALDAIRSQTVSTVIGLPIGWFMLIGVLMLFVLTLTAAVTARRMLRGSS
jgi:TRAP-type C4-dicarboxylate transport system permease small subunit